MLKMIFIPPAGAAREVDAPLGRSVMEVARLNGIGLEGRCEGALACSTCHVVVAADWFERVGEPGLDEQDMLDLVAVGLAPTSRLSCQIVITAELNGLIVRLPARRTGE